MPKSERALPYGVGGGSGERVNHISGARPDPSGVVWRALGDDERLELLLDCDAPGELTEPEGVRIGVLGPELARRRASRRLARLELRVRGAHIEVHARLDGPLEPAAPRMRIVVETVENVEMVDASDARAVCSDPVLAETAHVLVRMPDGEADRRYRVRVEIQDAATLVWAQVGIAASDVFTTTGHQLRSGRVHRAGRVVAGPHHDQFVVRPRLGRRARTRLRRRAHRASAPGAELLVFPYYPNNPYQRILYSRLGERFAVTVAEDVPGLLAHLRETPDPARPRILHLNWTAPIAQQATTGEEAARAAATFLEALDDFRAGGGHLVWTVHNTMPHELRHRDAELTVLRGVVERADRVIVMNPATPRLVADDYALRPETVVVHPHPNYRGRFRDEVSTAQARLALGLAPDATVLLLFGTLRPYKGLDRLLEAFARARIVHPELVLLVAGEVGSGVDEAALRRALDVEGVHAAVRYVPADDAQFWIRAADAMVLPYLGALNPSLVYLAATFGRPVLLSDLGALDHLHGEPWVRSADFDDPDALLEALPWIEAARAGETRAEQDRAVAGFLQRTDPAAVADAFTDLLEVVAGLPE